MKNTEAKTRSETLFLYNVFRCNPNGGSFENRPRRDPGTGRKWFTTASPLTHSS